jgi:hypothetical protein
MPGLMFFEKPEEKQSRKTVAGKGMPVFKQNLRQKGGNCARLKDNGPKTAKIF